MASNNQLGDDLHTIFSNFLKKTLIDKKSHLSTKKDEKEKEKELGEIFTTDYLKNLVNAYVVNYIGQVGETDSKKFDQNARDLLKEINCTALSVDVSKAKDYLDKCGRVKKEATISEENKKKVRNDLDFESRLKEQLLGEHKIFGENNSVDKEAIWVFANLMWLRYLPMSKKKIDNNSFGETAVNKIKNTLELKSITLETEELYSTNKKCIAYGRANTFIDSEMTDLVLLFNELVKWSIDNQFVITNGSDKYILENDKQISKYQESQEPLYSLEEQNHDHGDDKKCILKTRKKEETLTLIPLDGYNDVKEEKDKAEAIKKLVYLNFIKQYIIRWCLDLPLETDTVDKNNKGIRTSAYETVNKQMAKGRQRTNPKTPLPLHNMLLFICDPKHYDNIAVTSDKKKIVETFKGLVTQADYDQCPVLDSGEFNTKNNLSYNKYLYCIYRKLNPQMDSPQDVNIYEREYKDLWSPDIDQLNNLKYKRAVVMYGPPGTSKTYTAKQLAKAVIFHDNYSADYTSFNSEKDKIEQRIHRLQLHPNYTYEDFIWGYQIENEGYAADGSIWQFGATAPATPGKTLQCVGSKTTPKKGYFLRLLDKIKKEGGDKVHVLILDEINRVDLSRLFGELFSAIENRDEPVDLPVEIEGLTSTTVNGMKVSQISVPKNLYIIGTMNEIDFSLERVDFALRRRFVWKFYGFNLDSLESIITEKSDDDTHLNSIVKEKTYTRLEDYLNRCKRLNKAIDDYKDLGKQYEIGHTFFAEIIDIMKSGKSYTEAKTILWNISICPMLEAFLGNCDEKEKASMLKVSQKNSKNKDTFADIFLGASVAPQDETEPDEEPKEEEEQD